ncbi:MAG: transketolase, partial [Chloroflexi bacterium]
MITQHEEQVSALSKLATSIRRRDLAMIHHAGIGHIGGDFSAIDILVTLYFAVLR